MFSMLLWRLASCLSLSVRRALIALIFKKSDRLDRKNLGPINLLNVDYKLCARVLAGRLLKVIATVVAPNQSCGVPGRYIGENVAFQRDVIELANEYNLPVALLSLNQEKAFDRDDWPFLFSSLAKMGFSEHFNRSGSFTLTFAALSLSMVTPLALLSLPVKCVKAVPCAPFCVIMKCWLLTSAVVLILLVCASLVFPLPSLYCPCMLMTRPPFRALIAPLERSSQFMAVSNKALVAM